MTRLAEMILQNATVLTVNPGFERAEAVAIANGCILAVGSTADMTALTGPATEIVDLAGRTVIPGLIDGHLHLHWAGLVRDLPSLLACRAIADVQDRIRLAAAATPPGDWIVIAPGWHETLLAENRMPNRAELDIAAPDHPLFIPRGGHVCAVNSRALALSGITAETPDPSGGKIVRDDAGAATGLFLDTACLLLRRLLPPPPAAAAQAEALAAAMADMNAMGVTCITEPGVDAAKWQAYQTLHEAGRMTLRTSIMWWVNGAADIPDALARRSYPSDLMLNYTGAKLMLDGGVEGARMSQPYRLVEGEQTDPEYLGLWRMPQGREEEILGCLLDCARAGLQVQIHTAGDACIDLVIGLYERVNAKVPIAPLRWTLMHIFLPTDQHLARMQAMGVIATVQDHSAIMGRNMLRWWGPERAARAAPTRDILAAGVLAGGGTDGPVVPVSPFISLGWFVTRRILGGEILGGDQAIPVETALRLYTINNAKIAGLDHEIGSIEPGKRADLAVLDADPTRIDPDDIAGLGVVMTLLEGRIVHERPGLRSGSVAAG